MTQDKIVVLDGYTLNPGDLSWDALKALGGLTVYDRTSAGVVDRIGDAHCVLTNKVILDAAIIQACPNLAYVGITATGTNVVDVEAAATRNIVVTNVPEYGTASVAQHTIALLLEMTNRVAEHHGDVATGRWQQATDFCFWTGTLCELADRRLGIVGLGAIGARVAAIGAALGMHVVAAERRDSRTQAARIRELEAAGVAVSIAPLAELFRSADVVSLHCPLTDESRHLVDAERLGTMKPDAMLINTARGALIDEVALQAALERGHLAGAAVDVLDTEPPSDGSPLIGAPRCIVTPHMAWATLASRQRLMNVAIQNVRCFLDGDPTNVVKS